MVTLTLSSVIFVGRGISSHSDLANVCPLYLYCDLFQKRDCLTLLYAVKYNKLLRYRLEIQAGVILLGQDDRVVLEIVDR